MSINPKQIRNIVIKPLLEDLEQFSQVRYSDFSENLLIATAAQETHCGEFLSQENGPARGIYQMEPATAVELVHNFIMPKYPRWQQIFEKNSVFVLQTITAADQLCWNLRFATLMARLFYFRVPDPLPIETTMETLWAYYKPHWNTSLGKATFEEFEANITKHSDIQFQPKA